MISVRRLLFTLAALVPPLALAAPDAVAARHHLDRTTQLVTAIYHAAIRPHASHQLRAARADAGHFAQISDYSVVVGS